jgi:alcohol dehydrogenase
VDVSDERALMLADILPTSYEVGVLAGRLQPGETVVVVGSGPIGLAAISCARLFSPAHIVAVDLSTQRLEAAKVAGADVVVDGRTADVAAVVRELTEGLGADLAIEAVGTPETFELCTELIRHGGRVANVGVHGRPAVLHLEKLWIADVTITMGLVDTYSTPTLLRLLQAGRLDVTAFATHHLALEEEFMLGYDIFSRPEETGALKVVMSRTR